MTIEWGPDEYDLPQGEVMAAFCTACGHDSHICRDQLVMARARIAELEAGIREAIDDLTFDTDDGNSDTIANLAALLTPKDT